MRRIYAAALLTILTGQVHAIDDNWRPLQGAAYLKDLVGGLTAEFEYEPGKMATANYYENGTAEINVGAGTFRRTWWVEGEDQVCYRSTIDRETNCFRLEQNVGDPEVFRAIHTNDSRAHVFRVLDEDTKLLARQSPVDAKGSLSAPSASEVAAELSNPNTALGSMNLYVDYIRMQGDLPGADSADATKLTFQPSMPYPLSKTANFFVRPLFPVVVKQDVPGDSGFDEKAFELGDIGYDVAVFNSSKGGFIYGGGVAGSIPSATDDTLGTDKWTLGPEVILAAMKPWGVVGLFLSHQWDVGGAGNEYVDNVDVTGGQYFYSFNIKNGWVFAASPTFAYNHDADDDNKLTFPVGIGASKTALLGGKPWKFGLQYWYYVESPDALGPQHQLRLQITPVIKLPW